MTVRFVDEAQREFLDAIDYYEDARAGLGRRFKDTVDRSVLWIADHPELYQLRPGGYRRINLRVFPFYIAYIVRQQTLWVLAVAHGSRKPLELDFATQQSRLKGEEQRVIKSDKEHETRISRITVDGTSAALGSSGRGRRHLSGHSLLRSVLSVIFVADRVSSAAARFSPLFSPP